MIELVTAHGWKFCSSAEVMLGDKRYDMDELTEKQQRFVLGKLNEQALNAAYSGSVMFQAENIPKYEEVFEVL